MRTLKNGINDLIKGPREISVPFHLLGHGEKSAVVTGSFTRTQPHWHPDLGLPGSRTVRNKLLSFVSHSVYGIC